MKLKNVVVGGVMSLSMLAFAQAPAVRPGATAAVKDPVLACPEGTRQSGGQNTIHEASFCVKLSAQGVPEMHGPMVSLHKNGKKAVEGQYENGKRVGLWVSFDEVGAKIEEVTFAADQFNGARVQWVKGVKIAEEAWVNGKRQGAQK